MPFALPTRPLRTVAALCLAIALMVLGALVAAPPAQAATPAVQVAITDVSPDTVDADGTITIKGTVTNTSTSTMKWVQASFWRSRDPIASVSSLNSLASSPPTVPVGERWFHEPDEASIDNITDAGGHASFKPGQRSTFSVRGTASAMGLTAVDAAYLVGVHVQAYPDDGSRLTVGRARVFTVVSGPSTRAELTPVIELSTIPSVRVDSTFSDDHLAADLTGRLSELVDQATSRSATVLVDPALVDEADAMAAGYTVNGHTGTGTRAAKDWLKKLAPLLTSGRAYRLPYGDADVVGAARQDHTTVLARTRTALSSQNGASKLPLAITDEAGALDTPTLNRITSQLSPSLVLTSAVPAGTATVKGAADVVGLSPSLLAGGPDRATSAPQVRGRLLAQALLMNRADTPAITLVRDQTGLAATATASWLSGESLDSTLAGATGAPDLPARSRTNTVLRGTWWADQITAASDAADWGNVLGDAPATDLKTARALSRGISLMIPSARRQDWLAQAMSPATELLNGSGVTLHSTDSFVMSSASNEFPLTITNRLTDTVSVKVTFTSQNPQRIDIPDTQVVTVGPQESQTVKFKPQASSNSVVEMTARLATPSGRPLGTPAGFLIRATRTDDIGWILIIVSGAVVLGATLLRVRQVSRRGTRARTGDGR